MELPQLWHRRRKPKLGSALAFTATAAPELAGIPATVVDIWPRLCSGDYLVTLEYAQPVQYHQQFIRQLEAFLSELEPATTVKITAFLPM